MMRSAVDAPRQLFLVEHYCPGAAVSELRVEAGAERRAVAAMERDGVPIHYRATTIVPRDEAFLTVLEAPSESVLTQAYTVAGLAFDRISLAIADLEEAT